MQLVVVKVSGVESPGVGVTTLGVVCAKAAVQEAVAATARMTAKPLMTASSTSSLGYYSTLGTAGAAAAPCLAPLTANLTGFRLGERSVRVIRLANGPLVPTGVCDRGDTDSDGDNDQQALLAPPLSRENAAAQHCLKGNTLIQHLTTEFQSQFDQNVAAAKAQMFQGQGIETTLRAMRSKLSSRPSMAKCT